MRNSLPALEHPIWRTVAGILVGYGIVLAVVFVLFFAIPFVLFSTL
ncbi:MAG: hypothetical protein ABEJ44_04110 [Halanaeroarchaeum sp.]